MGILEVFHCEVRVQTLRLRLLTSHISSARMEPRQRSDSCVSRHNTILTRSLNIAYWIAFGPHGPRALPPPGENWYVFRLTMLGVGISFLLFWAIRSQARPAPKTMNAQYQEMTNEYLKVSYAHKHASGINLLISSFIVLIMLFRKNQKTEPITGVSSEGYVGKGMVQSKPRKGGIPSDDDE